MKRETKSATTPVDTPFEDMGITFDGFMKAIKATKRQMEAIPANEQDLSKRMDYLISFK